MRDAQDVEILPYDNVEVVGPRRATPRPVFRVVGFSASRNIVKLKRVQPEDDSPQVIELPPFRIALVLDATDPRSSLKRGQPRSSEEIRRQQEVLKVFMMKRSGAFDEWDGDGVLQEPHS